MYIYMLLICTYMYDIIHIYTHIRTRRHRERAAPLDPVAPQSTKRCPTSLTAGAQAHIGVHIHAARPSSGSRSLFFPIKNQTQAYLRAPSATASPRRRFFILVHPSPRSSLFFSAVDVRGGRVSLSHWIDVVFSPARNGLDP